MHLECWIWSAEQGGVQTAEGEREVVLLKLCYSLVVAALTGNGKEAALQELRCSSSAAEDVTGPRSSCV